VKQQHTNLIAAAALVLLAISQARAEDPPPLPAEEVTPFFSRSIWHGGVELGVNGSEGNTRTFNGRAGANASRETDELLTKASISYKLARTGSDTTENKALAEARNDWKLGKDSRWSIFAQGTLEYDDFQDWDLRVAVFTGVGYRFFDEKDTKLNGRVGVGASREIGGSDDDWTPEALLGADLLHQITERQRLTASIDVYPSLSDGGEFRSIAKAAWEVVVDPEVKMSLKIGVEDRYDSDVPAGIKRNDFDYFAMLVWSF
jgi:putative salt-induced outer membrane protein YdiY